MSDFLNIHDPTTVVPLYPERPPADVRPDVRAKWIKSGQSVTVGGILIRSGNFYLGETVGATYGLANDGIVINPAYLNPSLPPVDHLKHEPPSFPGLPFRLRLEYLKWLANGASDKLVPVEFPLLYFYGLEHRLMVDTAGRDTAIFGEIIRLQGLFPNEQRLQRDIARVAFAMGVDELSKSDRPEFTDVMQVALKPAPKVLIYLGRRIAVDGVIDADDAWLWLKASFKIGLQNAALKCPLEFERLFKLRFAEAYPAGFKVGMTPSPLRLQHRLATWRCSVPLKMPPHAGYVADIEAVSSIVPKLRYLATRCSDELEHYSRFVSRKNVGEGRGLEAIAMLPDILKRDPASNDFGKVIATIDQAITKSTFIATDVSKFLDMFKLDYKPEGQVTVKVQASLAGFLDGLGYGFEPDRRYGSAGLAGNGAICLFKAASGGGVSNAGSHYPVARLVVEFAVLAARVDGEVNQREMAVVKRFMDSCTQLNDLERRRLTAVARAIMKSGSVDGAYMAALAKLAPGVWDRLVRTVGEVIAADGTPGVEETRFLEKMFKARKLQVNEAHALLMRQNPVGGKPDVEGLSSIAKAVKSEGVVIAPEALKVGEPTVTRPAPVEIDFAKLAVLKKETAEVAGILHDIFQEPEIEIEKEISHACSQTVQFDGLDEAHGELLVYLLREGPVDRSAFGLKASEHGLYVDGAIETINEWAYDRFDDPAVEDGSEVSIDGEMVERLNNMMEQV